MWRKKTERTGNKEGKGNSRKARDALTFNAIVTACIFTLS